MRRKTTTYLATVIIAAILTGCAGLAGVLPSKIVNDLIADVEAALAVVENVMADVIEDESGTSAAIEKARTVLAASRPVIDRLLARIDDYVLNKRQVEDVVALQNRIDIVDTVVRASEVYDIYTAWFDSAPVEVPAVELTLAGSVR